MEQCNNCDEEIKTFTLSHATLETTGEHKIKILRLGCPFCNQIQYSIASDSQVTALTERVKLLEERLNENNKL